MSRKRSAVVFAVLAVLLLLGGFAAGLALPRLTAAAVAAGFVGYVACGRRAMLLSRADHLVFAPRRYWNPRPPAGSPVAAGFVAGTISSFILGHAAGSGPQWSAPPPDRPAHRSSRSELLRFRRTARSRKTTLIPLRGHTEEEDR